MAAIRYLVDTLLSLLSYAFLLRLLLQWVRANFRDPLADAIVRVTNWLIMPLRRLLPPLGKVDSATVVATLAVETAHNAINVALLSTAALSPLLLLELTLRSLAVMLAKVFLFALLLYWIVSFVNPGGQAAGVVLLKQLCEPVLRPVRRLIPPIGQIDFSPLWVSIALVAILILIERP
jgi:YggT family protein